MGNNLKLNKYLIIFLVTERFEVLKRYHYWIKHKLTWTTSDETVIDVDGKVIRGAEDKDVTITATYTDGDLVIYFGQLPSYRSLD